MDYYALLALWMSQSKCSEEEKTTALQISRYTRVQHISWYIELIVVVREWISYVFFFICSRFFLFIPLVPYA